MIREILNSHAATLQKAWAHDRSQTIGASDIGQCSRKTFWVKNAGDPTHAAPVDPEYRDGWGAKIRGTIMENAFWEPAMRNTYGDKLLYAGAEQKTFISGFLSATPDGIVTDQALNALAEFGVADISNKGDVASKCFMAECKTADPRSNLNEAKAENVFQTQVQMGLVRELTPFKPNYSLLSYTDASFWDEVVEFAVPFDQKIFDIAKMRAREIMTAKSAKELKPEGWIAGGRECEYCPFTHACGIERRSVPESNAAADPQFVAEVTDLARAIQQFDSAIDFNTARMRDMQDDLRTRLRTKGVRKIPGVLTWSHVKGRSGYNNKEIQKAAVDAGVDIEQFATQGEPTDRMVITLPVATPTPKL